MTHKRRLVVAFGYFMVTNGAQIAAMASEKTRAAEVLDYLIYDIYGTFATVLAELASHKVELVSITAELGVLARKITELADNQAHYKMTRYADIANVHEADFTRSASERAFRYAGLTLNDMHPSELHADVLYDHDDVRVGDDDVDVPTEPVHASILTPSYCV